MKSFLPYKMLTKFKLPVNIQIIPYELNLRKEEWLFVSIYKPALQNNQYFASTLSNLLDFYSNEYDNKLVLGDFNLEPSSLSMLSFIKIWLTSKKRDVFQRSRFLLDWFHTIDSINLVSTNRKCSFKTTSSYETWLSDHHHLIYLVMKTRFKCEESKKLIYRNYPNSS